VCGLIHFKGQGVKEEFSHPSNLEDWKHCVPIKMSGNTKPATRRHVLEALNPELKGSMPRPQEPAICPDPNQDSSSPHN
jgi:hypothetical protein